MNIKKLLLIMRLTTVLLLLVIMQVSANSLAQKITLSEKNTPLESVFKKISKQSGYDFLFTGTMLKESKNVTVNVKNADFMEVLHMIFKNQPIEFRVDDKTVFLSKRTTSLIDKLISRFSSIDVQGIVVDSSGSALSGATVTVKGTGMSVRTNEDGNFYLENIDENSVIVISYLGYGTKEVKAQPKMGKIMLSMDSRRLEEVNVINTGYQVLSKQRATGSFSKPDMQVYKDRNGSMDIIGRLEGLVPGLTITSTTAQTGETYKTPVIRGKSSIELDNSPLYVVNGVIVTNLNSLNPNDVADITVLKDAVAAAIWGAKAANGVIVITTKSGTKNQKLNINYSGFINFGGKPDFNYGRLLNSQQFIQAAKETFDPQLNQWDYLYNSVIAPHELVLYNQYRGLISEATANKSLDSLSGISNKGQIKDLMFQNAMTINNTLSLSGGNNQYSFYGSASYTKIKSSTPGADNETYGLNFTQDIAISKFLKIALNTSLSADPGRAKRPVSIQDRFLPYQLFQDPAGNPINMPYVQGWSAETRADFQARSRINLDYIPLNEINYGYNKGNNLSANLVGNAWLKLLPGLTFHGTYGYTKIPGTIRSYDDHRLYRVRKELLGLTEAASTNVEPVYYLPTTGGTYSLTHRDQQNYTLRNQLEYVLNPRKGSDRLTLQVGQEANEQFFKSNTNTLYGYDEALQTYAQLDFNAINNISDPVDPEGGFFGGANPFVENESKSRAISYFALASYTLNDKYSLDASWRIDHSNLIGSDKSSQNKPIWSIGGKWNVSKEDFMKSAGLISDLGLRATYGVTGNSPFVGASSSYNILSREMGNFGATYIGGPAFLLSRPANRKLNWESTQTINLGIDFTLWKRISASIDLYRKKTTDLLGERKSNPLTGYSSFLSNIGNLGNQGIELSIHSRNIENGAFGWSSDFIFAYNKNKLVSYSDPTDFDKTGYSRIYGSNVVGFPLNALFAYQYAGLDNLGDPMIRLADGTVTKEPEVAKAEDVVYKGSINPKFSGGLTNNLRYKGFGLTINMIYNLGHVMRTEVNEFFTGRLTLNNPGQFMGNIPALFADRWKVPGDETTKTIPSYVADGDESLSRRDIEYYTKADINVVSASYAKIRDITLSYSLAPTLLKSLKIAGVRFNAQATNFMLWKANHKGLDPEFQDFYSGARRLPQNRHTFSLGANITF
ncbi:SusC/RagA family TonB-linked outer membrane protein [Pedobacter hiemivivus]|uniref:SusC/RagA family TonB-linked outer membrane protein n=1 Tax=Pedobacter hiemivivus TaxID=2530454 RepID=A0A4R0N8Q1_9SPHI|nr:SusC/RagA family TonB-linked outer membrane protein [Pedobacter hiemivivus]TCC96549.1 SusC/RagA family TonB-linked outer membrane protein [Pedobacter hiemivivus]